MRTLISSILIGAAGFAVGLWLPIIEKDAGPGEAAPPPVAKIRDTASDATGSGAAGTEGLAAFVERAAGLRAAEWPGFFRAHRDAGSWSRLAAEMWADNDPAGFWRFLTESGDRALFREWSGLLMERWAVHDPHAAMRAAMRITDRTEGDRLRYIVAEVALDADLATGLEIARMAGDFSRFGWGRREWIEEAPGAAARGLATLPAHCDHQRFLKYATRAWAEQDPAAALAWMSGENPLRDELTVFTDEWMRDGFAAAAKADPQATLEAALSIDHPAARDPALEGALRGGALPLEDALDHLGECGPRTRARVAKDLLTDLKIERPEDREAASRILAAGPSADEMLEGLGSLMRHPDREQWSAVWDWAGTLPDMAMRRRAREAMAAGLNGWRLDEFADHVARTPLGELSNQLFRNALTDVPQARREAWIARLPAERAAWVRGALAGDGGR